MSASGRTEPHKYAEVVLDLKADLCLTYLIPEELDGTVEVGQKVAVNLGRRRANGFVTGLTSRPPAKAARPLLSVLRRKPFFAPSLVDLIRWVARYYFCSFPRAFKTALPAAVRRIKSTPRIKTAELSISAAAAVKTAEEIAARAPRQAEILKILARGEKQRPARKLLREANAAMGSLLSLQRKGLVAIGAEVRERDSWSDEEIIPTAALKLNREQQSALNRIKAGIDTANFSVFLLHGITGSGKTEIYLQSIARALERGRGAIVLVPEISLTPQIGERFKARFGDKVAIIHSALSDGERYDQWQRISSGRARIVLGPRSAVFAPVERPGLIIVDEEHVTTYKQSALSPYYHARDVAVMRAKLEGATALLGSATPSLESYYNCRAGKYALLKLAERPGRLSLPRVEIVDMRREIERAKRYISFSPFLLDRIRDCLEANSQCILFLNRRGFHTLWLCRKCGYVAKCRHCSISLTYHKGRGELICHLCGYHTRPPRRCPLCGSKEVLFSGLGTQRVESQIKKIFPGAAIARMDTDSMSFRDAHRQFLRKFKAGKIDIMVGTQMIAKGLDYPNITLVGVIFADTALNLADFRATEYTFQILTQVAGRSGRGEVEGTVVIQTYSPRHPAIRAAARQEYEPFYEKEIAFRKQLGYPPFNHFISVTVSCRNEEKSRRLAEYLGRKLLPELPAGAEILGPAPPPITRIRGSYRWQLLIKTKKVLPALAAMEKAGAGLGSSRDVKIEVDVDPISML